MTREVKAEILEKGLDVGRWILAGADVVVWKVALELFDNFVRSCVYRSQLPRRFYWSRSFSATT